MMKTPEARGFLRKAPSERTIVRCQCGGVLGDLAEGESLATGGRKATQIRVVPCPGCGKQRSVGIVVEPVER